MQGDHQGQHRSQTGVKAEDQARGCDNEEPEEGKRESVRRMLSTGDQAQGMSGPRGRMPEVEKNDDSSEASIKAQDRSSSP